VNQDEYQKMAEYEESYWWHIGRNAIVDLQLKAITKTMRRPLRILNVGAGTGGTVPTLAAYGEVHNVDAEPRALEFLERRGIPNVKLVSGVGLSFDERSFDVIVAMDVLEHIDAENAALREWRRLLKDDGELLIMVPAYSWLWSAHDEALRHFRRYNRTHLGIALRLAGFEVIKRSYAISFSLPLVAGFRMLEGWLRGDDRPGRSSYVDLPGPVNSLLTSVLRGESQLLRYIDLPWGTSLIARARRRMRRQDAENE
jgi:SAM-dependent methyltransferase